MYGKWLMSRGELASALLDHTQGISTGLRDTLHSETFHSLPERAMDLGRDLVDPSALSNAVTGLASPTDDPSDPGHDRSNGTHGTHGAPDALDSFDAPWLDHTPGSDGGLDLYPDHHAGHDPGPDHGAWS